ncbi:MAG: hypothetical protein DWH91_12725 [Planctomycetota bacterium]|nr:MAG: hypothetical protein DWH91_12725 [Planctomycetota bacterium]
MVRHSQKRIFSTAHCLSACLSTMVVLLVCTLSRAEEPEMNESLATESPSPAPTVVDENASDPVLEALSTEPVPASEAATLAETLWQDRPLNSLKATLRRTEGDLPPNLAAPRLAQTDSLVHPFGESRPWVLTSFEWTAPGTKHLPLLFEEPNLERLGYTHRCHCTMFGYETSPEVAEFLQPLVSGGHFLGNAVIVPYRSGIQPLDVPVYTLGVDRPGSPLCHRDHELPLNLRGAVYQAGVATGLVFLIP